MPRFVTHEPLAQNLLNLNHSTATGPLACWSKVLTNGEPLIALVVQRLESDYSALSPKMRKPWNGKEVDARIQKHVVLELSELVLIPDCAWNLKTSHNIFPKEYLQRTCGAYLAAVDRYREVVPAAFFQKTLPEIEKA